ncbi:MAG: aspartate aminotransferase family protein [Rhodospirillaceae bacterium]|nr:aspartate aminotransferase family protein [Rhodospirillaceae bacterium]|tara:strand:+ start:410 stop:1693 length:1284 start_codon:yes stop_codon:yes gene_type:complete
MAEFSETEQKLQKVFPGGRMTKNALAEDVNFIICEGKGARVLGTDGDWRIDYVCGAGALVLGHAYPEVVTAVRDQASIGTHFFGLVNDKALELAEELVSAIPCADRVIFTTTGSEATYYAMRFARAFTGRDVILKFEGGYHGNHDYSNISVAPNAASNYPSGQPDALGIPDGAQNSVIVAPFNDLEATARIIKEHKEVLAGAIVEPVQRVIFPDDGFLQGLRDLCDEAGILLLFDEVVTGFRLAYGGAQEFYGVKPDLASYGKIMGGGLALGAVGGREDILLHANPGIIGDSKGTAISGTLHGNPLSAAAGLACLKVLKDLNPYQQLRDHGQTVRTAFQEVLDRHNLGVRVIGQESWWQFFASDRDPQDYVDFLNADMEKTKALDLAWSRERVFVMPNTRRFVSVAHTDKELDEAVISLDAACRAIV